MNSIVYFVTCQTCPYVSRLYDSERAAWWHWRDHGASVHHDSALRGMLYRAETTLLGPRGLKES